MPHAYLVTYCLRNTYSSLSLSLSRARFATRVSASSERHRAINKRDFTRARDNYRARARARVGNCSLRRREENRRERGKVRESASLFPVLVGNTETGNGRGRNLTCRHCWAPNTAVDDRLGSSMPPPPPPPERANTSHFHLAGESLSLSLSIRRLPAAWEERALFFNVGASTTGCLSFKARKSSAREINFPKWRLAR